MWARYVSFYLCQRMRHLRQQRFLTLSQNKKKVVSDSPEVHLNVSKQLFLNFHFLHWFILYLVKMAKLACDLLCQRMRRMQQHVASVCGAYASKLLAQTAHTLAKSLKMSFCKRMLRMRLHIASVCGACSSTLLAYAALTLANCQRMPRIRQHFASVDGACGSQNKRVYSQKAYQRRRHMRQRFDSVCGCKLLAQTVHTVAICQCMQRMRQQIASVDGAYGSNLLAYTAHAVAKPCKIVCFPSVDGAHGSKLQAYAAHAVALCQRRRSIRQQFASVDGACGS